MKGCTACLSVLPVAAVLSSCKTSRYIAGTVGKDGITISKDEFKINRNGKTTYRMYVIVRNEALQFPICVYRFAENNYSALWMSCTHQGTELQVSGQALQCPAHGSEFNSKGNVTSGPADQSLRSFAVTETDNQLFIDLRKV
jgi:Rieske Fe-S protein